jgi:anion-transporting  ArsA/GET3 family ATPase
LSLKPLPFASRQLLVCVGPGGVGKTTLAAAIGLREARAGRKVLVCTIDPARRLANSMGLRELDNREARVELTSDSPGQLYAMMLDLQRSWDDLIARTAKNTEQRDRIYQNRFYQQLSTSLAGSQEYAAVAKLAELAQERDYDLIVLDTPPTIQALDFLDAPNRILDFLDNPAARLLLGPALVAGKVGLSLLNRGSAFIVNSLSNFTGIELLQQLAEFMLQISGMYDTFKARALEVRQVLQSETTGFVLVTSPNPYTIDEALNFSLLLHQGKLPLRAIVANRVSAPPGPGAHELGPFGQTATGKELFATLADAEALADRDATQLTRLSALDLPVLALPRLDREVFDLEALDQVGELLANAATSGRLSAA